MAGEGASSSPIRHDSPEAFLFCTFLLLAGILYYFNYFKPPSFVVISVVVMFYGLWLGCGFVVVIIS